MKKFERDGVMFSVFERDGERYLCTGNPTGEINHLYVGEICDMYTVVGATSVVSASCSTIDELYDKWLEQTKFYREIGVKF